MINNRTISRCARSIVASMNLDAGDNILIRGGSHSQQLLEDVAYECYRAGSLPMITSSSDDYVARVMRGIKADTLGITPGHLKGAWEGADCLITIDPFDDPSILSKFPRSKTEARSRSYVPLIKILDGEGRKTGKKWCFAGWPTPKQAEYYGIDYDLYERFVIGGLSVPAKSLRRRCEDIAKLLDDATRLHVTDPEGTDLDLVIKGRRRNLDDGFVSDEDVKANDRGNNLPAGEVFVAPHETKGSGKIFCPIARDEYTGRRIVNAELPFERGRLDLEGIRASEGRDEIVRTFRQSIRIDEGTRKRVRTLNLAEIGIGCNPRITRSIGCILTDEKISGSVHVAFGDNFAYGGTSRSILHWDFVTVPKVTMVATMPDGTESKVIQNGRIKGRV